MATTTNYGWDTPDDTDLVKDGAAAIRTLGNSIDTTTKNLNPETTLGDIAYRSATSNTNTRLAIGSAGQVLTVAAGVPSWASPSDQTPLTTKGDVFTFSTVDARLGVGANGTVLTADSAEATGLKWATPAAGGKVLQVVSATTTTQTVLATTTSTDTGITATITPSSATSKILIIMSIAVKYDMASANDLQARGKVFRGATTIADYGNEFYSGKQNTSGGFMRADSNHYSFLDNPTTTSATTYKLQSSVNDTSSSRQVVYQPNSAPSTITLLEIGA
jgi:hypothetical protein